MRWQRLFGDVLAVSLVVAVIITLVFAQPMSGLIEFLFGRDVAPAFGPGRIAFDSARDRDR